MILFPLLLLSHLILLFFTHFTLWPEMVVYPYLLNHGFLLYRDIINPYPPLLTYKLSVFASLFGYQPLSYQILTWLLVLITDIVVFIAAAKITKNPKRALLATFFFVVLSIPFGVNGLWYDLVQTPFIIVAAYFFARHLEKKIDNVDLLISAVSLAIDFFIKQQALWLTFWFLGILIYRKIKYKSNLLRPVFIIIAPIIIGFGLEALFVLSKGLFRDFFFWTVILPLFKASQMPGYVSLPTIRQAATLTLFFIPFIPVFLKKEKRSLFYLSCSLVLLLFAYPRFGLFHLIPSLSILAIVFGSSFDVIRKPNYPVIIPATILLFFSLVTVADIKASWTREVRFFEKDVYQAANVLQKVNPKGTPIFLQNVSGQILVVSQTLPTKPWADSFPWYLEIPGIQEKVLAGILNEKPNLVVYKPYSQGGKYQIASYRPQKIADFLDQNYQNIFQINSNLWIKARMFK